MSTNNEPSSKTGLIIAIAAICLLFWMAGYRVGEFREETHQTRLQSIEHRSHERALERCNATATRHERRVQELEENRRRIRIELLSRLPRMIESLERFDTTGELRVPIRDLRTAMETLQWRQDHPTVY